MKGMFEQMLSILVYIGDDIKAGAARWWKGAAFNVLCFT